MYSVVLLAALTTGGDAPEWGRGHGCHGCYGGCYGCYGGCNGYGGCYGCYGYGGCFGGYGWGYACYGGCYGGYGYGGCFGGCYGCYGGYAMSPYGGAIVPGTVVPPTVAPSTAGSGYTSTATRAPAAPARVIVDLPEDAKLFVDDQLMKTASAKRVFRTPDLDQGQTYFYILRAEVNRDGQTLSQSKRILVRAGEEVRATLDQLEPKVAAKVEGITQR